MNRALRRALWHLALLALLLPPGGCTKRDYAKQGEAPSSVAKAKPTLAAKREERAAGAKGGARRSRRKRLSKAADKESKRPRKPGAKNEPADDETKEDGDSPEDPSVQTRAWFPETFLFRPLVVTDASGKAKVSVRVPDRLTSWRVLALAHSRSGGQAGAVASFLGTLPVYVEPVVPPQLRIGDRIRLPINIVNTTAAAVKTSLTVSAAGLTLVGTKTMPLELAANKSVVRYVTLEAKEVGTAKLLASLQGSDRVVRTIEIVPLGRPLRQTVSGTLASPRTLTLSRVAGANTALGKVRLQVFPGALALLRSELRSAGGRGRDLADEAFALLLAGRAPKLIASLGGDGDAEAGGAKKRAQALRDMRILATQRILRRARVLNVDAATVVAEAALAHPQDPVLQRLGKRAMKTIARLQAPDGTCGGATGWTLQRLLVATADCARAASSQRQVAVRASGAFERNVERIKDAYTAAAVLASGAVSEAVAKRLRKLILLSIKPLSDGSKGLFVPSTVRRADGRRPSPVEAAALAVLALVDVPNAPVSDLGARILSGYSPGLGWGDGRANLLCMKAALKLFRNPLPKQVTVTLRRGDDVVAKSVLEKRKLQQVVTLEGKAGAGEGNQKWTVGADPAVAGLGYSLTLTDWVPWKKTKLGGIEMSLTPPKAPTVGKTASIAIQAAVPGGQRLTLTMALPAGVQVDKKHLDRLIQGGPLDSYEVDDAALVLRSKRLPPAKLFKLEVRVIPTLGGALFTGATVLRIGSREIHEPPARWSIK